MIDGYICEYENDLIGHGIFVYELYVKITLWHMYIQSMILWIISIKEWYLSVNDCYIYE